MSRSCSRTGLSLAGLLLVLTTPRCTQPMPVYQEGVPMTVALVGDVPVVQGRFDPGAPAPAPVLFDTGSALTTIATPAIAGDAGTGATTASSVASGSVLHLYDQITGAERVEFPPSDLLVTREFPIGSAALGGTTALGGVLGGDLLGLFAVELAYDPSPTAPGSGTVRVTLHGSDPRADGDLAAACNAVIHVTPQGGGVYPNPDACRGDNTYSPTRLLLDACLDPDAAPTPARPIAAGPTGVDASFLLDTGSPALIVTASTASLLADPGLGAPVTLGLPTGPVTGAGGQLSRIALVNQQAFNTSTDARGPCYELWCTRKHELFYACHQGCDLNACSALGFGSSCDPSLSCSSDPAKCCLPGKVSCKDLTQGDPLCPDELRPPRGVNPGGAASVILEPSPDLPYVRVADETPVIQALRDEITPGGPQIAGLLGTTVLARLLFEVDYPDGRVIASCANPADPRCRVQPADPPGSGPHLACCGDGAGATEMGSSFCGAPP